MAVAIYSLLSNLLHKLVDDTRANLCYESSPLWMISLLKKGAPMSEDNEWNESAMTFFQIIIFHEKNVTEFRKLFFFLQFLGVKSWCHKKNVRIKYDTHNVQYTITISHSICASLVIASLAMN